MPLPLPYTAIGEPIVELVPYNGVTFKTVTWKVPEGKEFKGKLIYVHGFCEHSDIYTQFFDNLSQSGYEVFFFDQRGAGETSPGKLVGKTDEHHTFDDLNFFIGRELESDPTQKFFLAGHSMGGGIVLNYAIYGKYKNNVRAIVACGPLVRLHPKTEPNIIVRVLSPVINALAPGLKIDSKLNYDFITSNEGWKTYIKLHDSKLIGSIRQFNDMFERGAKLLQPAHVAKFHPDIALLVVHGSEDNINSVDASKKFIDLLSDKIDHEFVPVEGGRHSLFIEREEIYQPVLSKVLEFLDKH